MDEMKLAKECSKEVFDYMYELKSEIKRLKEELESQQEINTYAIDKWNHWHNKHHELDLQNQRYREALEFYAKGEHLSVDYVFNEENESEEYMESIEDKGEKAQQALKEDD